MAIVTSAPTRIDLAGGTVDLWPLYLFHPGAQTINFAISLYANCRLEARLDQRIQLISKDTEKLVEASGLRDLKEDQELDLLVRLVKFFAPEGGFTLTTECLAPAGSGLGGSSALNIAVCAALNAFVCRGFTKEELLTIAQNIETQVIKVPAGLQDYYPPMYGGLASIALGVEGVKRQEIGLSLQTLNERVVLCYTGKPHFSGTNNWEIYKKHIDGDKELFQRFDKIRDITASMQIALKTGDMETVAELLNREWQERKLLSPGVSTEIIEKLIEEASKAGSIGAKVCGAGGGGCITFIVDSGRKEAVEEVLRRNGGEVLAFQAIASGVSIEIE
ncbi:MAG: GHMP kinase [Blastocatellia bacterium]|nr:GHMP kinase [Blastocatellia bacterium]